jgi:hypothetical protein
MMSENERIANAIRCYLGLINNNLTDVFKSIAKELKDEGMTDETI